MTLTDQREALMRVCFRQRVDDTDLRVLGGRSDRWLLYRDLVRSRFHRMTEAGLPKAHRVLGSERFAHAVDQWLEDSPSRSRYLRDVVPEFAEWCCASGDLPPWALDLLRFEATRWKVGYADVELEARDGFRFEGPPPLNPTLELLALDHPVHESAESSDPPFQPRPTFLAVVRRREHRVAVRTLTPRAFEWLEEFQQAPGDSVVTSVQRVAQRRGEGVDEALVTALSATVADLLTHDVLLGTVTEAS